MSKQNAKKQPKQANRFMMWQWLIGH